MRIKPETFKKCLDEMYINRKKFSEIAGLGYKTVYDICSGKRKKTYQAVIDATIKAMIDINEKVYNKYKDELIEM